MNSIREWVQNKRKKINALTTEQDVFFGEEAESSDKTLSLT
jgi:hypothetical protein